jgi:hypothetical protein
MKKKSLTKDEIDSLKKSRKVIELPSNNDAMEKYVEKNRPEINEAIVDSIEYAVNRRLGGVEVFCFKNSNFVVILTRKDFKENLENIFEYSLHNELFEVCGKVKRIKDKLEKLSHVYTYKKIK